MKVNLLSTNGIDIPLLYCDDCGLIIKDANDAVAAFNYKEDMVEMATVDVLHDACETNINREGYMPLPAFFYYIITNLNINMKKAKENALELSLI